MIKVLGIVGSEAAKFDSRTEELARELIRNLIANEPIQLVVSGACHLGGIDVWAIEEARAQSIETREFPPKARSWEEGYKLRNQQIAHISDKVVCITIRTYPEGYKGMRFGYCYHCKSSSHVKSGGCWTVKYAAQLGKQTDVLIID